MRRQFVEGSLEHGLPGIVQVGRHGLETRERRAKAFQAVAQLLDHVSILRAVDHDAGIGQHLRQAAVQRGMQEIGAVHERCLRGDRGRGKSFRMARGQTSSALTIGHGADRQPVTRRPLPGQGEQRRHRPGDQAEFQFLK